MDIYNTSKYKRFEQAWKLEIQSEKWFNLKLKEIKKKK